MEDTFDALSHGECVETCLGHCDFGGLCFQGAMLRKVAWGNIDGCMIDGGA